MRNIVAMLLCTFVLTAAIYAQDKSEPRVIEVSGSAERLITPDLFTFKITLSERMENKQKITMEQQEAALREELAKLGVDVAKDLSIYDISSTYFRQKRVKDVLGTKGYRLKINDLNKIARLQDLADRLNVSRLELIDTDHSDITRLRRETKMDAIRAAQEKASYLLGSIGQRIGKAVYIKEIEEPTSNPYSNSMSANYSANTTTRGRSDSDDSDSLSFTQIRLRYVINAKFEIQ
jgi:uncharacterized protein YggE